LADRYIQKLSQLQCCDGNIGKLPKRRPFLLGVPKIDIFATLDIEVFNDLCTRMTGRILLVLAHNKKDAPLVVKPLSFTRRYLNLFGMLC
jgi:hypothetical protein